METKLQEKGNKGEQRATLFFRKWGYEVIYVGGAIRYSIDNLRFFCADLLVWKKGKTFWVQVKYKEPRKKYPDTGLEKWRYEALKKHQRDTGLKVMLVFTDDSIVKHGNWKKLGEGEDRVYGNWLDKLPTCISHFGNNYNSKDDCEMIYFLLSKLKKIK